MKTIQLFGFATLFAILGMSSSAIGSHRGSGAVFSLSNDPSANEVLAFHRDRNGLLKPSGSFPTGGKGSGDALGSQGALTLSSDGELLFAVDAGSNEIASFAVEESALKLLSHVPSCGERPISITVRGDLVYVLNAGGDGNIAGFVVGEDGSLASLDDSTQPLSGASTMPAQVSFTPDGEQLVVTEKGTNQLDIYRLGDDGRTEAMQVVPSSGTTPFGFAFASRDTLVVSEAFDGEPGASAVSSYRVEDADLPLVSPSVADGQTAACWVAIANYGRTAFTTNTGSGNISSYRVHRDGTIELLEKVAASTGEGSEPIDMAVSRQGRFLHALASGTHQITTFRVAWNGSLEELGPVGDLPPTAVGLAAF